MGKWTFDCETGPRVVLGEQDWWEISITPNWEYSAAQWLDLAVGLSTTYTHQAAGVNSYEARPYLGIRPYFYTGGGIRGMKLLDFLRYEYRAQYTFAGKNWIKSSRIRNRIQAVIPMNRASALLHGALSIIVDVEAFVNLEDLKERFSSRLRFRVGITYNRTTFWRYQFFYTLQQGRDTIDEPFSTTDSIFRFRVIHFF